MSYQAERFYSAATATAARLDDEAQQYLSGTINWRRDLRPKGRVVAGTTGDRAGIEALIASAAAEAERQLGVALPWNTHKQHGLSNRPHDRTLYEVANPTQADEVPTGTITAAVEHAARLSGFLRHGPDYPMVRRLMQRGLSGRGTNSPASPLVLENLTHRWRSPGQLDRHLRKVQRRANEILTPLGMKVSWHGLASAASFGSKRIGKAALIAAASTVNRSRIGCYKLARSVMVGDPRW